MGGVSSKNDRWPRPDTVIPEGESEFQRRPCVECGASKYYLYPGEACYDCEEARNPCTGTPLVLIDAGGEDSPLPERIADGSHWFNAGLPPVQTVSYGEDGKPRYGSRPISNAELGNNAGVREYAKRHGLEPMTRGRFRGLR